MAKKEENEEKMERNREDEHHKDVKVEVEGGVEKMELVEEREEEKAEAQEMDSKEAPTRPPPLHVTRVVYLPYLPLSVHRATVETVSWVVPFHCFNMEFTKPKSRTT